MACAQVFGLERGFVCECTGEQYVTTWDHCDGPHSIGCRDQVSNAASHSKTDHSSEDTREHVPYKEDVKANAGSNLHVAVPQPVMTVIELFEQFNLDAYVLDPRLASLPPFWETTDPIHGWPHVLSRVIVLRV